MKERGEIEGATKKEKQREIRIVNTIKILAITVTVGLLP